MDKILDMISSFNIPNLIATGAIFWYFTRDVKNEMKILESKLDARIEAQAVRTDRLYEMFIDLLKDKK